MRIFDADKVETFLEMLNENDARLTPQLVNQFIRDCGLMGLIREYDSTIGNVIRPVTIVHDFGSSLKVGYMRRYLYPFTESMPFEEACWLPELTYRTDISDTRGTQDTAVLPRGRVGCFFQGLTAYERVPPRIVEMVRHLDLK